MRTGLNTCEARFTRKVALTKADLGWFLLVVIGLALTLMMNGVYDGVIIGLAFVPSFASLIDSSPLTGGVGYLIGCVALLLLLMRRRAAIAYTPQIAVPFSILLSVSIAMMIVQSRTTDGTTFLALVSGLTASAIAVILLAFWAQALARAGRPRAFAILACALVVDTLLDAFIRGVLTQPINEVVVVLLALASPVLLLLVDRIDCPCSLRWHKSDNVNSVPARSSYDTPFWVSVTFIALAALVMGPVQSLARFTDPSGLLGWMNQHAVNVGALATAVVSFGVVGMRTSHANMRAVILVLLICSLYFASVFGMSIEPLGRLSMTIARMTIVLYIFLLACDIPWHNGWPMFAFVVGWGVFTVANTTSTRLGFIAQSNDAWIVAYDVYAVGVLTALVCLELHVRRVYADSTVDIPGADDADLINPDALAVDPLLPNCRAIAEKYGLTSRELDVLVPLVHGRSAATISQHLGMSVETARTHIRHIYAKTDIHCREDLMDEVETVFMTVTQTATK